MNRFLTLLLTASCLTAVGQVPDYVPTDGLLAWYPLDGDANDVGPNQFVGQLSGTTAYEGHLGNDSGSFWFDGDAFVHSPFLMLSTEQGVTYTAWVHRENGPGIGYIVSYGNAPGTGQSFCLAEGGNYGLFATAIGQAFDAKSFQFLPMNEWTFVATTILNNEVSIYINGQVVYEDTIQQPTLQLDGDLRIGVNPSGQGEYWVGAIDDLGVWNRALSEEEIQEVYIGTPPLEGCTDEIACNYDADATVDDGSCHFNCQFCHDGTVWDEDLFKCVVANPADINFDGCVQLNDLLDLLSAYGDCGAEESAWQCGDPLEYQGYDYETVQIGEQCWFAENCRHMPFVVEGVVHPTEAAIMVQGYLGDSLTEALQLNNYINFGALYNHQATEEIQLCPNGWHIPTDSEYQVLEISMGMSPSVASETFWRGENEGDILKSSAQWNGANTNGFNALPAGTIGSVVDDQAYFWTSSSGEGTAWQRVLATNRTDINRNMGNKQLGYSVRCIKD